MALIAWVCLIAFWPTGRHPAAQAAAGASPPVQAFVLTAPTLASAARPSPPAVMARDPAPASEASDGEADQAAHWRAPAVVVDFADTSPPTEIADAGTGGGAAQPPAMQSAALDVPAPDAAGATDDTSRQDTAAIAPQTAADPGAPAEAVLSATIAEASATDGGADLAARWSAPAVVIDIGEAAAPPAQAAGTQATSLPAGSADLGTSDGSAETPKTIGLRP